MLFNLKLFQIFTFIFNSRFFNWRLQKCYRSVLLFFLPMCRILPRSSRLYFTGSVYIFKAIQDDVELFYFRNMYIRYKPQNCTPQCDALGERTNNTYFYDHIIWVNYNFCRFFFRVLFIILFSNYEKIDRKVKGLLQILWFFILSIAPA